MFLYSISCGRTIYLSIYSISLPRMSRWQPRYARCGAVPSVLAITIPQMNRDGHVVEAHVMNVASTANYGFVLEFELTVANVEYLYNAFAASPPSYFNVAPAARKKRRCHTLKPMYSDTPDVVERAKLTWQIVANKPSQ